MSLNTIAIMSPGDMGHAVGRALGEHGYDVITCLQGRSERSRKLAQAGNFRDVSSLEEMVTQADLVLSILVPSQATNIAEAVAKAIRAKGTETLYADCNAVSPQTTRAIESIITAAGGRYIDGGIIGGPPGRALPRFYVSGPYADIMTELDGKGISVPNLGGEIGRASGIKMCYAAMTKGTSTLYAALLTTAHALGLSDELRAEFESSQPDALRRMEGQLPRVPANAHRWIGEMEEIAATFAGVGVTSGFHDGAAEMYRLLSQTPFADESPESVDPNRTLADTIAAVADLLPSVVESAD